MYLRRVTRDEHFMTRCLQLARLGERIVAPNPMVGAVIVHNDRIIGEGYHAFYGGPHAEVNAVASVEDESLLPESTIYVTLEPCSHFGKTPPCADLIIRHRFKRVVIGTGDPNEKVNGRGIERLRNAGIEVLSGVLEDECRELNRHFFTFHQKQRPYIVLKWAQTPEGLLDNADQQEGIAWISAPETKSYVHRLRAQLHGILVGRRTVEKDDPSLTVREVHGLNPIRIVLDSNLSLSGQYRVLHDGNATLVLNTRKESEAGKLRFLQVDTMEIPKICDRLHKEGIQSVLVEGGRATLQSFIDSGWWDEARVIIGQHSFREGTKAPHLAANPSRTETWFGDTIYTYFNA